MYRNSYLTIQLAPPSVYVQLVPPGIYGIVICLISQYSYIYNCYLTKALLVYIENSKTLKHRSHLAQGSVFMFTGRTGGVCGPVLLTWILCLPRELPNYLQLSLSYHLTALETCKSRSQLGIQHGIFCPCSWYGQHLWTVLYSRPLVLHKVKPKQNKTLYQITYSQCPWWNHFHFICISSCFFSITRSFMTFSVNYPNSFCKTTSRRIDCCGPKG